ncbi:methionine ABC transporter ATP-binding protein [Paraburkholderia caballeronis]|uniref:Cell division ATP-binding protein FtsE n=1 Tax=Paraburkholderia caballeronis TaxID=416943 RepID=A0A1H7QIG0_9BURK|nr:methionine ABC transporter ATP-binding protein [Paraburkholderia caballeronis]PXW22548.1 D-methionine transport system ATP-binding protein [Paraburkholderia caballeronis]PXW96419.1 D-methionine transport system ATP-binding protein [Paraburkholderia caballeronis]RAJ92830.1 D-methionine transport system ATP-binding protein [Paraburkholderia caballeronis]TDV15010.1 D-methionine transport system ATP-binding protein [Paraburkholderia caballeronis]TDV16866.1 D-methionine transport system ATP-bind
MKWFNSARFVEPGPAAHGASPDADPARPAVVFDHVGKVFGGANAALSDVTIDVARGEVFGIIGRSGAGKSTLLRLVNGLEKPTSGTVRVHGVDVGALDSRGLVALRRRIGMVFQHFNLLSAKTVYENIALPLKIAGVPKAAIDARVNALLDLVGLADRRDAWPARLSGGQKQRVGIARALVHEPDLLLCDEATSALDPETTRSILALLRDINRRLGVTIVLITHEMEVIRDVCDTVAVIERGELVETGPVWRVFGDPRHDATRALLHRPGDDLPEELAARLRPLGDAPADASRVLFDVRFTGERGDEPDLVALAHAFGAGSDDVRFVHGGIERIQGRPQGRLVVAATLADGAGAAALAHAARSHASRVEVLGHV